MSKPLSQRSHSNCKDSKGWQAGSMPYGKASKSARSFMTGKLVEAEARVPCEGCPIAGIEECRPDCPDLPARYAMLDAEEADDTKEGD